MKKSTIRILLLLGALAPGIGPGPAAAPASGALLSGKWQILHITVEGQTAKLPPGSASFELRADKTGTMTLKKEGKTQSMKFTWQLDNDRLVLIEEGASNNDDAFTFSFYDRKYLFLIKGPRDNMLLKRAAPR